jgi:hypothetical protein
MLLLDSPIAAPIARSVIPVSLSADAACVRTMKRTSSAVSTVPSTRRRASRASAAEAPLANSEVDAPRWTSCSLERLFVPMFPTPVLVVIDAE